MIRRLIFLLLILGSFCLLPGQARDVSYNKNIQVVPDSLPPAGELKLYQERRLDELDERYRRLNSLRNGMDGYRIQIFFESGREARENAYEAKAKFLSNYHGIGAYIEYHAPFFKVRIGDFRTKREAYILYRKLKRQFPNAYITPIETIRLPEIE